jgi:hypothetical protein
MATLIVPASSALSTSAHCTLCGAKVVDFSAQIGRMDSEYLCRRTAKVMGLLSLWMENQGSAEYRSE